MKYVPLLLFTILVFGGMTVDSRLQKQMSANARLINENLISIVKIENTVSRIDEEQKRRTKRVDSIPEIVPEMINLAPLSGIIKITLNGTIQDITDSIEVMTDLDEDELVGTNITALMDEKLHKKHKDYIKKISSGETAGVVMEREAIFCGQKSSIKVSYIPTEKIFLINIREI